jgi:hypothetical protein
MRDFSDGVIGPIIESIPKLRFREGWREAKDGRPCQRDRDRFYYLGYNAAKALSHNDWKRIWEAVKPKS